jgi:drug/metabolite transporter (DMT)-like permease
MEELRLKSIHYFLIFLIVFFWATGAIGVRYCVRVMSPSDITVIHLFSASIILLALFFFQKSKRKPCWRDIIRFITAGVCGCAIYNWGFNIGAMTAPASIVSFIVALSPVVVAVISRVFLGEKITRLSFLGLCVGVLGLVIILFNQQFKGAFNTGLLYAAGALLGFSIATVIQKSLIKRFHPLEVSTYCVCLGTLAMIFSLPHALKQFVHLPLHYEVILVYIGIFPIAVATIIWMSVMRRMTATQASTLCLLSPFIILILAWFLLHELPTTWAMIGVLITVLGTYLVIRFGGKQRL